MRMTRQDEHAPLRGLRRHARPPIERFHLLRFETLSEGIAFCHRVVDFLQWPEGIEFTEGTDRAVLWVAPAITPKIACDVFASWGALRAARRIGLPSDPVAEVVPRELPPRRALVFGEASDRDEGEPPDLDA